MTTVLTIYGFGLRGNSACKSTRKHRFRTKKPRKAPEIKEKNQCRFVWEHDAAGSSPVTPTNRGVFHRVRNTSLRLVGRQSLMYATHTKSCFAVGECSTPTKRGVFHRVRNTSLRLVGRQSLMYAMHTKSCFAVGECSTPTKRGVFHTVRNTFIFFCAREHLFYIFLVYLLTLPVVCIII